PVADPASFDAMVLRLSRDRMGAGQRTTGVLSGHQVVSYRRDPKSPAALSYTIVDGYALLSAGEGGPAAAAAAAAQEEPRSLAARSGWARARAAVAGYPVVCFAP